MSADDTNGQKRQLTDRDTSDNLTDAAVEVKQHAHVVLFVPRLLENVLRPLRFVSVSRSAFQIGWRVGQDDSVRCREAGTSILAQLWIRVEQTCDDQIWRIVRALCL